MTEMGRYHYTALPAGWIRLLRLLPDPDAHAPVRCQLFDYYFLDEEKGSHPYEALSYVWGSQAHFQTVLIGDKSLSITRNLYAALKRLRYRALDRILWADAICINQEDDEEKRIHVQSMAMVYAYAFRVVVWLEEAIGSDLLGDPTTTDSDTALEVLRVAASGLGARSPSDLENDRLVIMHMLERSWFQRIWVLQEVAAARHVIVASRSSEIDGYAFSIGLEKTLLDERPPDEAAPGDKVADQEKQCSWKSAHLTSATGSIIYLIKGAIHRAKRPARVQNRFSLKILPLAALLDLYHDRKATDQRDKVFALLGMSSDRIANNLLPNYKITWEELFHRLVRSFIATQASIGILANEPAAIVRAKGWAVGLVVSAERGKTWDTIDVKIESPSRLQEDSRCSSLERIREWSRELQRRAREEKRWRLQAPMVLPLPIPLFPVNPSYEGTIHAAPGSIRTGDIICLFQGGSALSILRPCSDYCTITLIGAHFHEDDGDIQAILSQAVRGKAPRDFLLVWDWEPRSRWEPEPESYQAFARQRLSEEYAEGLLPNCPGRVARMIEMSLVWADLGLQREAYELFRQAADDLPPRLPGNHNFLLVLDAADKLDCVLDGKMKDNIRIIADFLGRSNSFRWIGEGATVRAARSDLGVMKLLLRWRSPEIEITEAVLKAAAGNTDTDAVQLMGLLLEHGSDTKMNIIHEAVLAAAKNSKYGATLITFLLNHPSVNFDITEDLVSVAVANYYSYRDMTNLLLDRYNIYSKIPESVFVAAAQTYSPVLISSFLHRYGSRLEVTDRVVKAAISSCSERSAETQVVQLLLNQRPENVIHTEYLLEAARAGSESVLKLLLDRYDASMKIPEAVVEIAASRVRSYKEGFYLLLNYGGRVEVTERVIRAATSSNSSMEELLRRRAAEVKVTQAVVEEAASKGRRQMMKLLLSQTSDEFSINETVVKAAAGNCLWGDEVMDILLDQHGAEIQITDAVIEALTATGSTKTLKLLLDRRDHEVKISRGAMKAAASVTGCNRKGLVALILARRLHEVQITQEVIMAAVENNGCGCGAALRVLLEKRSPSVRVTEKMLEAVARNDGDENTALMASLMRNCESQVKITEQALKNAMKLERRGEEMLSLLVGKEGMVAEVTEEALSTAATDEKMGFEFVSLLLGKSQPEVITEKVIMAAMGNRMYGNVLLALLLDEEVGVANRTKNVLKMGAGDERYGADMISILLGKYGDDLVICDEVLETARRNARRGDTILGLIYAARGAYSGTSHRGRV